MRMCELLVGLPDVTVLGVDELSDGSIAVHVEQAGERPNLYRLRHPADGEGP